MPPLTNGRRVRGIDPTGRGAESDRGQALILWILAATVILVMGAIVVDVGLWLTERRRAQGAADFAALAAATELKNSDAATVAKGLEFAKRNGFDDADSAVEVQVDPNYAPDMVQVTIKQGSPMFFSGIFGAGAFDIGARAVGTDPALNLDVVIILDRSASIEGDQKKNAQDIGYAKNGAKAALAVLEPTTQHVALGVMSVSDVSGYDSGCSFIDNSWVPVPLRDDYDTPGNPLVAGIDCLGLSDRGTNWAEPIRAATAELQGGRPGARKAIILLADGHPQDPSNPCQAAVTAANQAKAAAIEIYTIGYAIENDICDEDGGSYHNKKFSLVLADIATDPTDDNPSHCADSSEVKDENADGDHFFCLHRSEVLAPVFEQIAGELARDYRLEE